WSKMLTITCCHFCCRRVSFCHQQQCTTGNTEAESRKQRERERERKRERERERERERGESLLSTLCSRHAHLCVLRTIQHSTYLPSIHAYTHTHTHTHTHTYTHTRAHAH